MKQKTAITFELEETITFRQQNVSRRAYCKICQEITEMSPPSALAAVLVMNEREIFRLVERSVLGYVEEPRFLVCTRCTERSVRESIEF